MFRHGTWAAAILLASACVTAGHNLARDQARKEVYVRASLAETSQALAHDSDGFHGSGDTLRKSHSYSSTECSAKGATYTDDQGHGVSGPFTGVSTHEHDIEGVDCSKVSHQESERIELAPGGTWCGTCTRITYYDKSGDQADAQRVTAGDWLLGRRIQERPPLQVTAAGTGRILEMPTTAYYDRVSYAGTQRARVRLSLLNIQAMEHRFGFGIEWLDIGKRLSGDDTWTVWWLSYLWANFALIGDGGLLWSNPWVRVSGGYFLGRYKDDLTWSDATQTRFVETISGFRHGLQAQAAIFPSPRWNLALIGEVRWTDLFSVVRDSQQHNATGSIRAKIGQHGDGTARVVRGYAHLPIGTSKDLIIDAGVELTDTSYDFAGLPSPTARQLSPFLSLSSGF